MVLVRIRRAKSEATYYIDELATGHAERAEPELVCRFYA